VYPREQGLYVANPTGLPWSGWITMPASALRGDFHSLGDPENGAKIPFIFEPGYASFGRPAGPEHFTSQSASETFADNMPDHCVRFWVEDLKGHTIRRFDLREEKIEPAKPGDGPTVAVDRHNWPTSARWPGKEESLFQSGTGDVISIGFREFAGRWAYSDIHGMTDRQQREQRRRELLEEKVATAMQPARVERNSHTTVYAQELTHPRLTWAVRQLELWHRELRARLTVRLRRSESELPEILFVVCDLPCQGTLPESSVGGMPFVPYEDQLPGSCPDYFTIDDWVQYSTPKGRWLWVSRDAPLVTFGGHNVLARLDGPPKNANRILAMVFNNVWVTNFVADSHGVLEFRFEMALQPPGDKAIAPARLAETLQAEPQVIINPGLKEHPIFLERLHRP
jgi:hypothetical protein